MSHVAAALQGRGHSVEFADLGFDNDRLEEIVAETRPRFIGLSLRNIDDQRIDDTTFFVPQLYEVVQRLRACSDAVISIGGSAYSLFPEIILEHTNADYGVVGEGEAAMTALIGVLETLPVDEEALARIPALVHRVQGRIVRNPVAPLDPGTIARAYRQGRLFERYLAETGVANVQSQRGCPFTCCYCTYPVIEGTRVRKRDAKNVVDEIIDVKARGAQYLFFVDSVFNIDNDHVASVCEELIRRDAGITWGCFLRPKDLPEELMHLMARAGLRHVEFGTDSLCDSVLESYEKGFTVEDVVRSDALADAAKIRHAHFLICGGPGETAATLAASFENSLRLRRTVLFPYIGMRLYPGTALYRTALSQGVISATTDLLSPFFYITPEIGKESIAGVLDDFHRKSPRWIVDDPTPQELQIIERLRAKSVAGPLWEFLVR
jgi:radical SAM superfamily enzyme YgiQ (UPF0313 family)